MSQKANKALAEWYQDLGCDQLYCEHPQDRSKSNSNPAAPQQVGNSNKATNEVRSKPVKDSKISGYESEARLAADGSTSLEELRKAIAAFDSCEIKKMAMNTVFADGNPNAEVMLIGEAPGATEDQQGIPFCGQSGKLLDNILAAVDLSRKNAYITNTIFWRPPGNRRPTPEELSMCRPFVEKHIALVGPKLIILVGSTAVESLLGTKVAMHDLRNNYYDYNNRYLKTPIKTAVIFHPSYLLRQSLKKKDMWLDMQKIKRELIDANN